MSSVGKQTVLEPFFLEGSAGRLFGIYYGPAEGEPVIGNILYAPPFAEEMNRSRRQASLQARSFADQGFGVLILDLFGTGDSDGEFSEARWDVWRDDLLRGVKWLQQRQAGPLVLWGVRLGALLALHLLEVLPAGSARLILWQPVISGKAHINQFLRLRVAADMIGGGQSSTQAILDEIERGRSIEVAGYELHPELVSKIASYVDAPSPEGLREPVIWLEVVAAADRPMPAVSRRLIDQWREAGISVMADTIPGEAFWRATEIVVVPELIQQTNLCARSQ